MKLRYVGNKTFALHQMGKNVTKGTELEIKNELAKELMKNNPKIWIDPKAKSKPAAETAPKEEVKK